MQVVGDVNHFSHIRCTEGLHDCFEVLNLRRAHTVKTFRKSIEITDARVFTELVIHTLNIAVVVGNEVFFIVDPINADVFKYLRQFLI